MGSIRHWHPLFKMYSTPQKTSHKSTVRGLGSTAGRLQRRQNTGELLPVDVAGIGMRHDYPSPDNSLNLTYFRDRRQVLRPNQISRRINRAALAAGLGKKFSGHSTRVGMAQDLADSGTSLTRLMNAGRWKSPSMPSHYTRRQAAQRNAVAQYYNPGIDGGPELVNFAGDVKVAGRRRCVALSLRYTAAVHVEST